MKEYIMQYDLDENGKLINAQRKEELVRCKDCKWWGYDDDDGVFRVCHAAKHNHVSEHWSMYICRTYEGDYYCADAERREDD